MKEKRKQGLVGVVLPQIIKAKISTYLPFFVIYNVSVLKSLLLFYPFRSLRLYFYYGHNNPSEHEQGYKDLLLQYSNKIHEVRYCVHCCPYQNLLKLYYHYQLFNQLQYLQLNKLA